MSAVSGRTGLAAVVMAVAVAVAGVALVMVGPPSEARVRRIDQRRVDDLQRLASAVDLHWTRAAALPDRLAVVQEAGALPTRDPVSGAGYEYRVTGAKTYELCAAFERDGAGERWGTSAAFWTHGAGRQCYQLEVKTVGR